MSKKTLVIGATINPDRYSYKATKLLISKGNEVVLIGIKEGELDGLQIINGTPPYSDVHTVTIYVGQKNQIFYYDYILSLNPKRVIFNPGTENIEFQKTLEMKGIEALEACTLVMLTIGSY